jgi:hypothetical protein
MNSRKRSVAVISLLIPVLLLTQGFGCSGTNYHRLVVAEHDFKSTVQAFQDAEIAEFQSGVIDPQLHIKMQNGILQVAQGGQALSKLIQQNASPQTIQAQLNNIYGLLDTLLSEGVLHVTNPKSKATLELALDGIKALVTNVLTLLPTPTVPPTPAPVQ